MLISVEQSFRQWKENKDAYLREQQRKKKRKEEEALKEKQELEMDKRKHSEKAYKTW